MREIKFKCWFPKTKRMTETFYLGQLIEQIENTRKEEEGIYLQYTGKKDKNGVEIYEGDILSGIGFNKGYVLWDNGAFRLRNNAPLNNIPIGMPDIIKREVIGNIYSEKK